VPPLEVRERNFKVGYFAYLYSQAVKPVLSRKLKKPGEGPYEVIARKSELNYEILNRNRKQVVHVNRLKPAYGYLAQETMRTARRRKQPHKHFDIHERDSDVDTSDVGTATMARGFPLAPDNVTSSHQTVSDDPLPHSPEASDPRDTPTAERQDLTYHPAETPRSRREMQTTRFEPPMTRI
jgi:hypothetical protein